MVFDTQEFADRLRDILRDGVRHPLYDKSVQHARDMSVHINGDKPLFLLERVRPRESDAVKAYRIENYEPTTKACAGKALDIVSKIFNSNLMSIRWKEKNADTEKLEQYTTYYYPTFNSLISYNKGVTITKMMADPNAVMAVKPDVVPRFQTEMVNPVVIIYGSPAVWDYDFEHFLICLNSEDENPKKRKFAYYDTVSYREFWAWYNGSDHTISIEEITSYQHGFDEVPAWLLRGRPKSEDNGLVLWESFFSPALPDWNLAVIHESDLLGAYINHMHPQKYELAEECSHEKEVDGMKYRCRYGSVSFPGKDGKKIIEECPRCHGSGYSTAKGPYEVIQISRQKLEEGAPTSLAPVGYIPIPVEATKMLEDRTRERTQRGMWSINMEVEDSVGAIQSGVAKQIDRSAQSDTLGNIAQIVFDVHLQNQYYFINKYMFAVKAKSTRQDEDSNLPEINKPTQFDVASTSELINNYKSAKDSGLDRTFLRTREIEILSRDLSTNPDLKKYQIAMLELDPLPGFSTDDIMSLSSLGYITKQDSAIHSNLKPFMDRAVQENANFITLDKSSQVAIFQRYADELLEKTQPKVSMDAINPNPDDIAA